MKFCDFIEIGTSDFQTEIQKDDTKSGISIEPVKYYLDKLPNKPKCLKLNMGISDYSGTCVVNFLPEKTIEKYNFPGWAKGCNSINSYHKHIVTLCKNAGVDIETVLEKQDVLVMTLYQIMTILGVRGVYFLKIDTEGHDSIILKKFVMENNANVFYPHVIQFESNEHSAVSSVLEVIELFSKKGYDLIVHGYDTTLKLNLHRLEHKSHFTDEFKKYNIPEYPPNYSICDLPHENTLESAQEYCLKHGCSGVTLQGGIYQVRNGKYIEYSDNDIYSWIFI